MKKMKKMKKILAMFLTMAMALGMSMTALAALNQDENHTPNKDDQRTVSVTNIKGTGTGSDGAVMVKAYKVVDANYDSRGFTGYSWVEGTKYLDKTKLTEKEKADGYTAKELFTDVPGDEGTQVKTLNIDEDTIVALANMASDSKLGSGIEMKRSDTEKTTYSADLTAGSYVVLVTNSDDVIYSPMLVGVYYTTDGTGQSNHVITNAPLDAESAWSLLTQNGFAKSSKPGLDKEIVKPGENGNDHGDDVAINDTISFKITMKMPSYSEQYFSTNPAKNPIFRVTDEISTGLTYKPDTIKVYTKDAQGKEVEIPQKETGLTGETTDERTNYTISPSVDSTDAVTAASRSFVVAFTGAYIKVNPNIDIIIKYDATLNENAGLNYNANTNKAKLEYSHNPGNVEDVETIDDTTYHYTFGIDALLNGENSEMTQELFKLDEKGTATVVDGKTVTVTNGLNGAKFELRKKIVTPNSADPENPTVTYVKVGETVTSKSGRNNEREDVDGWLSFTGLDAGEYILVETEAPQGYSLDPKEHEVVITAEYYDGTEQAEEGEIVEKGRLKFYSIEIDGEATSTYTATYTSSEGTVITTIDKTELGVAGIKNTKLAQLPSTGGIGTTIFTIGGCAIMIIAAGLFFATRRKAEK